MNMIFGSCLTFCSKIRQHNSFTKRELDQYNWIFQHIRNDLWGFSEDSLIPSLCHFIVPVVHTLEAALADAAGELLRVHNAQPLVARLKREASELPARLGEHYALAEPDLLSEAFRNVFTNMRHALDGEAAEFRLDIELKEVADELEPTNGSDRVPVSRQLIRLDIVTPGDIARVLAAGDAPTTLARQKAELRNFGVLLGVSRPAEGDGVRWRFTLRSRRDHVHMLRRDLGRISDISSLSAVGPFLEVENPMIRGLAWDDQPAEDNYIQRLKDALHRKGVELTIYKNEDQFIEKAIDGKWDFLITDLYKSTRYDATREDDVAHGKQVGVELLSAIQNTSIDCPIYCITHAPEEAAAHLKSFPRVLIRPKSLYPNWVADDIVRELTRL